MLKRLGIAVVAALCFATLAAAEPPGPADQQGKLDRLQRAAGRAGWVLTPLMLASAALLTFALARSLALRRKVVFPAPLKKMLDKAAGDVVPEAKEVADLCTDHPGPLARVVLKLSKARGRPLLELPAI